MDIKVNELTVNELRQLIREEVQVILVKLLASVGCVSDSVTHHFPSHFSKHNQEESNREFQ